MTYGLIDKTTADYLRDAGIDPNSLTLPDNFDGSAYTVDIIFDGALDESWMIPLDSDRTAIVDAVFNRLADAFPDNDIEVSATHTYVGPDVIEGSGYLDSNYVRRTD